MRILVTGASGFIGRVLVTRLAAAGLGVRAAVRRAVDLPCEVVAVGAVDGSTDWRPALPSIDVVVHLAGCAYVPAYVPARRAREKFLTVNVRGTEALCRQAAAAGVGHFIFVSSVGAVSEGSTERISAETPCAPQTAYGVSKLEAERILRSVAGAGGMQWTILRPPLVYGAGNPGNIARLCKLVLSGFPLPLASVCNRRSFVYVENLTDVILQSAGHAKAFGKIYFPSDNEDVSTPQLIGLIAAASLSARHVRDEVSPKPGMSAARLFPFPEALLKRTAALPGMGALRKLTSSLYVDSVPLQQDLAWQPRFTMKEGLKRTLEARP